MSDLLIRPFRPEDLDTFVLQDIQAHELEALADPIQLLSGGEAWTLLAGERGRPETRRVRACGGLIYYTAARAQAWALIGRGMRKREWALACRKMRERLDLLQADHKLERVQAETYAHFAPGHKLLLRLGFRFECLLPFAGGPEGRMKAQFARYHDDVRSSAYTRYDKLRALAYSAVIEDYIEFRHLRSAA